MVKKYDVIIIGAGIAGLTSAAILSKKGRKVLVLEKNPVPGGYAVSFKRKGFEFNISMHLLNGYEKTSSICKTLKKYNILDTNYFKKAQYAYRSVWPDFEFLVPQGDLNKYIDILTAHFPKEKNNILKLFATVKDTYKIFKIRNNLSDIVLQWKKYSNKSFEDVAAQFIKNHKLRAAVSQLSWILGLPSGKISFINFAYLLYDITGNGCYYFKGGGAALTGKLVLYIRKNGGELLTKSEVAKVLIRNGKSVGVVLSNKKIFYSDAVISGIDARTTFFKLINQRQLPVQYRKKIAKATQSLSGFQVFLGLNCDLRDKGMKANIIFVNQNFNLDNQYKASLANNFYKTPIIIGAYSNIEYCYAPKGKSVMSIFTSAGYDYWEKLSKAKYKEAKKILSKVLISRVEKIIPHLSEYIETEVISTPLTLARYTGNYKGAICGWEHNCAQPSHMLPKQTTPIENLYLVGHWTHFGSGISQVMYSGITAAEKILSKREP